MVSLLTRIGFGSVVAGLTALVLFWFFPNEEKVIRKLLASVEIKSRLSGSESALIRIARMQQLAENFDTNTVILLDGTDFGPVTITGRSDLSERLMAAAGSGINVRAEFSQVAVKVNPDKMTGEAEVAAILKFGSNQQRPGTLNLFRFILEKRGKQWTITRLEAIKGPKL